ncbi:hypothetical protein OIDMADRAFT_140907 [Oidiodendron maius Zn]|uniref:Uncharacterized protein n=1 Tax=Oidiodendron maius (strain Zn) TaxID=913774 RepID=A0A0C3HJY0_OIDMZ|nr:hypothetical protein OIDMADRAFT_140907 [Oidiodendron maius Zn]
MPRDTGTAQRRSGYEWPLAIIFLYLWQIIVVVIAEYLLIGGLIFFGFKTCHQLQPEDMLNRSCRPGVILKIRSRKAEIRDEERPLLDEDRPREPPAHPGIL